VDPDAEMVEVVLDIVLVVLDLLPVLLVVELPVLAVVDDEVLDVPRLVLRLDVVLVEVDVTTGATPIYLPPQIALFALGVPRVLFK